ncbi:MAG: DOMON-like domain-containing protein [Psychrobacter glacincola]
MSQSFDLYLASETLADDAQQLGVTVKALQQISVQVNVTLVAQPEAYLQLQYRVTLPAESLAAQLAWPKWQADKVGFKDCLWEQTCLECFLAGCFINSHSEDNDNSLGTNKTKAYIEINASPNGQYALYEFDSYRYPSTLLPRPLLQADRQTRAFINWNNISKLQTASQTSAPQLYQYERRFRVPLSQWYDNAYNYGYERIIDYIHPCVILSFGDTTLYFAPKHASPPDFHNRQYWARFDG